MVPNQQPRSKITIFTQEYIYQIRARISPPFDQKRDKQDTLAYWLVIRNSNATWGLYYKKFYSRNLRIFYNSQCLTLASLSSLVQCLWVRPGTYPKVEHLKGASLGQAPALPTNTRLGWKGLPGTNTSLLQKSINYDHNKFYDTGPCRPFLLQDDFKMTKNCYIKKSWKLITRNSNAIY